MIKDNRSTCEPTRKNMTSLFLMLFVIIFSISLYKNNIRNAHIVSQPSLMIYYRISADQRPFVYHINNTELKNLYKFMQQITSPKNLTNEPYCKNKMTFNNYVYACYDNETKLERFNFYLLIMQGYEFDVFRDTVINAI